MEVAIGCDCCRHNPERDMLLAMFYHQQKLQERLGIPTKTRDRTVMTQHYIDRMLLSVHEEAVEIGRATLSKHKMMPFGWKETQVGNEENYREEIIDLWHFVMNLWLVIGGTPEEFYDLYCKKNKINHERQDNKY